MNKVHFRKEGIMDISLKEDKGKIIMDAALKVFKSKGAEKTSVRDIMSGEFITGAITMIKAFFIALAIAFGVGVGLKIMRFIL